ncbi:MAG: hypothetical protein F6K31_29515 [Symploca sp. SIO2G7]|nr:hypothetical protein [Symploca sp. SIO2G7]
MEIAKESEKSCSSSSAPPSPYLPISASPRPVRPRVRCVSYSPFPIPKNQEFYTLSKGKTL